MRALLLPLLLIAGCASSGPRYVAPIDTGFSLQVNETWASLPNYTRIYFQHGGRVPRGSLDRWTTYCMMRVFDPAEEAAYTTRVEPGRFGLASVKLRYQSSDYPYYGGYSGLFGSIGFGLAHAEDEPLRVRHDGPPAYLLYRIEMKLTSPDQPDVQTLTCEKKWATRGNYYPTLAEIRAATGDAITFVRN